MKNNVNRWISKYYDDISIMSKNITKGHNDSDELLHNCLEQLMSKSEQLENLKDKELKWFFSRILYTNWNSKTSPYHYQFRKHFQNTSELLFDPSVNNPNEEIDNKKIVEQQLKDIDLVLRDLKWFDRALFNKYYNEGYSYQRLSNKTGISYHTIASTIRRVKRVIKEKLC